MRGELAPADPDVDTRLAPTRGPGACLALLPSQMILDEVAQTLPQRLQCFAQVLMVSMRGARGRNGPPERTGGETRPQVDQALQGEAAGGAGEATGAARDGRGGSPS